MAPERILSANLCADQLLLAMVAPQRIAGLSELAADPSLSPVAETARRFPLVKSNAEDLIGRSADLVLIGAYDRPFTRAVLESQGLPVYPLPPWSSLDEGRAQIRALAARLGEPDAGARIVAAIDASLQRAKDAAARPATFLILHRRGYAPGAGSVTSEIARATGMIDIAAQLGVARGGFLPLEAIVAARPDYLIVSDLDPEAPDQGKALLLHPALEALYPPSRRLVSPDPLTLCAGPSTPLAIDGLAGEIRRKVR